jgi:hypothetical protein
MRLRNDRKWPFSDKWKNVILQAVHDVGGGNRLVCLGDSSRLRRVDTYMRQYFEPSGFTKRYSPPPSGRGGGGLDLGFGIF